MSNIETVQQRRGIPVPHSSVCPHCQALNKSPDQRSGYVGTLQMQGLNKGSAQGCRTCSIIRDAAHMFLGLAERSRTQDVSIRKGHNGLWNVSLYEVDSKGIPNMIGLFEMFTLQGASEFLPQIPNGNIRQGHTSSKTYLDYILPWSEKCATEHPICRSHFETFIPKRVLDVGCIDEDIVRLVDTQVAIQRERYICLSHKWGAHKPIQTTRSNIADHTAGISSMQLPPTFRDAVKIVRYIGVRYLWIDSLCIIQDDYADWVQQSAQMADIYGNAFLTISATISEDASSGVFKRVPDNTHVEIPHPFNLKESTKVFVRNVIAHSQYDTFTSQASTEHCQAWDSHYPLNQRAWAYQEQVLSPRVVYFGHHELFWQCNMTSWCCCSPHPNTNGLKGVVAQVLAAKTAISTHPALDILTCWERLVRYYSEKHITKVEDRLPALSGVAKRFQSVLHSRYLAGLWADNLVEGLCWEARTPGRRPHNYVAPSWSWCSTIAPVYGITDSKLARIDIKIQEASCTPSTIDATGAVSSGFIRLSGFLLQGKARISDNKLPTLQAPGIDIEFSSDAVDDGLATSTSSTEDTIYGLTVGCLEEHNVSYLIVLILTRSSGLADHFRRVGIGLIAGDDEWKDIFKEECTITLI